MSVVSANMEWLFTEAGDDAAARVRAAAEAGIDAVEIWGWRDKDLDALRAALDETGVTLLSMIVDPQLQLTDPRTHPAYLDAVRASLVAAQSLHCDNLVVVAGDRLPDVSDEDQRRAVVSVLRKAARIVHGTGVRLLLENLNDRVDHAGTFLSTIEDTLTVIDEVDSAEVLLLLDAYHAIVMGEDPVDEVAGRMHLVGHVQIADVPGRGEPGSGTVHFPELVQRFRTAGYTGRFGLEYDPVTATQVSLRAILAITDPELLPARP